MIETLVNFDRSLFLLFNSLHSEFMDDVMWWVADRFFWLPLYVTLAALLILLSDQGSVFLKNSFERLRPCHDESLTFLVHTVRNKCGGQFGFVSSHAANTIALFTYILMITRNSNVWITRITAIWVLLVGYCRVYMGVHFPADIIGGWIVGIVAAIITYIIYRLIYNSPLTHRKS